MTKHINKRETKNGITTITYWLARIKTDSENKKLGYFKTPEEAAMAYDLAAIAYHGEFANINFRQK